MAQLNLYPTGAVSTFIPFITPNSQGMNYVQNGALLNQPGQLWLKLNNGPTTLFTMNTGSTGIIGEGDISGQDSAHALTAGVRMTW